MYGSEHTEVTIICLNMKKFALAVRKVNDGGSGDGEPATATAPMLSYKFKGKKIPESDASAIREQKKQEFEDVGFLN